MYVRALFVSALVIWLCWSAELPLLAQNATPSSCTAPPASAGGVTIARFSGDLFVQWTDTTADGSCRATRFYVEYSRGGSDVREFPVDPPVGSDPSLTIAAVPFGGAHRIVVRSFNARGISSGANRFLVENACFWPAEPVSFVQAHASGRIVSIGWQHPGHCFITGWRIGVTMSPDGPEVYATVIANPIARSFAAEAPPGTYFIRVYGESYGRVTAPSPVAVVSVQ